MKTSLNSKTAVATGKINLPVNNAPVKLSDSVKTTDESQKKDDLLERVQLAIDKKDESQLAWLNLEIQIRNSMLLEKIDWKLWEIYAKYVR